MITLEIEFYYSLESLADDIRDALKQHPHDITSKDRPLRIELSQKDYDRVIDDLTSYGSFDGIRTQDDLKYNTWQVSDEYVSFLVKPEKKEKEDGAVSD